MIISTAGLKKNAKSTITEIIKPKKTKEEIKEEAGRKYNISDMEKNTFPYIELQY